MMIKAGELHNYIKPAVNGQFSIKYRIASEQEASSLRLRSAISRSSSEYWDFQAGTYVVLEDTHKKEIIMSDTPMELRTNERFISKASGDVLIGGLGLGIIVLSIQDKPEVKSITIVEKNKEIIEMITAQVKFNEKVTIIHSDIFDFKPKPKTKYDTVYFDIWNNITSDNLDEIKKLEARFKRRLNRENEHNYIDSWQKRMIMRMCRNDRRYGYGY